MLNTFTSHVKYLIWEYVKQVETMRNMFVFVVINLFIWFKDLKTCSMDSCCSVHKTHIINATVVSSYSEWFHFSIRKYVSNTAEYMSVGLDLVFSYMTWGDKKSTKEVGWWNVIFHEHKLNQIWCRHVYCNTSYVM